MPLSLRRPAVSLFRSRAVSLLHLLSFALFPFCVSLFLSLSSSRHTEDDNGDRKRGESETGITRDGVAPVNGCGRMVASAGAHRDTLRLDAAELSQLSRTAQLYATVAATSGVSYAKLISMRIREDFRSKPRTRK